MKKHFLILLLAVTPFFAAYSQVTIPDEVARYYLEQNQRAIKLDSIIVIKDIEADILEKKVQTCQVTVKTYQGDSEYYANIIEVKNGQITLRDKQIKDIRKETRRQYRQKVVDRKSVV